MAGAREGLLGLGAGVGDQPVGFGVRGGERGRGVGLRPRAGLLRLLRGVVDELVAAVQHVLRVVQLAGQRLADVVEQLKHVAAGDDAVRGHRDPSRLLDHGDQRVEGFEDPVHGADPLTGRRPDGGLTLTPACLAR